MSFVSNDPNTDAFCECSEIAGHNALAKLRAAT